MKIVYKYTFPVLLGLVAVLVFVATNERAQAQTAGAKAVAKKAAATHARPRAAPATPGIIWRGDRATERAFVDDLVKQYESSKLGKVTLEPFSTISGIDAVHDGGADVAGSARPAMPGRAEETGLTFYPVAWEALVPITSPENPVDNVTLHELYQIYLGYITSWKDLGGADARINLYSIASPLDGVEYSMRKLLFHHGDQPVAAPRLYLNTAKLEDGITIDPHGLGFSTLSAVYGNKKIKILSVEGCNASSATIADGSYPLYSILYLAARDDGKNHEAAEKFIKYASSDTGKAIIRKHHLVPYDDAPNLVGNESARDAFVDAHVATVPATAVAVAASTPVSAPIATADNLRTQPDSVEAPQAKQRAANAAADMKKAKAADKKD